LREQLNEKSSQLEELQAQMNKREEELQRALNRSANHLTVHIHQLFVSVSMSSLLARVIYIEYIGGVQIKRHTFNFYYLLA